MVATKTKSRHRVSRARTVQRDWSAPRYHWKRDGIDFASVRKEFPSIIRSGLGKYELLLNRRLIETIESEFRSWLRKEEQTLRKSLRRVPPHARGAWVRERYASYASSPRDLQEKDSHTSARDRRTRDHQAIRLTTDFLFDLCEQLRAEISDLRNGNLRFRNAITNTLLPAERQRLMLRYAAELGASGKQLRGDRKAFKRWFDEEALIDRYSKKLGTTELLLTFVLDRLGIVLNSVISLFDRPEKTVEDASERSHQEQVCRRAEGIWERLQIDRKVQPLLTYDGDTRLRAAAFRFLARCTKRLPEGSAERVLDGKSRLAAYQGAMNFREDVWVQCDAFNLLFCLSTAKTMPLLLDRLANHRTGDDMFVRRHLLEILRRMVISGYEANFPLPYSTWRKDPSPFVRQKLVELLFALADPEAHDHWRSLIRTDPDPKVRACGLIVGVATKNARRRQTEWYLNELSDVLKDEENSFVIRTALFCCEQIVSRDSSTLSEEVCEHLGKVLLPAIRFQQYQHSEIVVRRWAAHTAETLVAHADPQKRVLLVRLKKLSRQIRVGKSLRLPRELERQLWTDPMESGRLLSVLTQKDFGLELNKGLFRTSITRGPRFGFRLWRLIHELRNPATDKRQALSHTVGRLSESILRAPSQICGELSQTKIPGEPLTIAEEGSWRPFLPLQDDFVSILNRSWLTRKASTRFFTSQGITTVSPPKSWFRRTIAAWKLTWHFKQFAAMRNWDSENQPASTYINSMRGLGFHVDFQPYRDSFTPTTASQSPTVADNTRSDSQNQNFEGRDDSVQQFFETQSTHGFTLLTGTIFSSAVDFVNQFADYFVSPWENTLEQLVIFAGGLVAFTLAKHLIANWKIRRARRNIPLSIGGWGTRGKSGTERLKAALIGVTGHGLVSKTTGCEAMFIHADPHGEPLEIPLFRPYDKATIWEQHNLLCMASRMDPSVFLWECMALTPSYVDVLQRQWTMDDLGTITNTYPDHEDLQGPAGHNVAQTISGFVPRNSHLLTTEEVMRPYVAESCRHADTTLRGVGWLESGLVTDDILNRFPYQEHPDNIALVAAMGDELGYGCEYCLKAMADFLVPDLGVLKTHPVANVRTRRIEFTNGMSANERFGCMGNWKRLGYADHNPTEDPGTWITAVVNNRADRVPRSKVFANIIVNDIQADRFFLIGSNLKGLMGFIEEAWIEKAKSLTLCDQDGYFDRDHALRTVQKTANQYRQSTTPEHIQQQLACILQTLLDASQTEKNSDREKTLRSLIDQTWNDAEELQAYLSAHSIASELVNSTFQHHREWLTALAEYQNFCRRVSQFSQTHQSSDVVELDREFAHLVKTWFDRRIVIEENFDASGEDVIRTVVDETPPGFLNRTMGLQNIKGTGLDFVYRFQAWDVCHNACQSLLQIAEKGKDIARASRDLHAILAMPSIGQLCLEQVDELLVAIDQCDSFDSPEVAPLVEQLKEKHQNTRAEETSLGVSSIEQRSESSPVGQDRNHGSDQTPSSIRRAIRDLAIDYSEHFLDVHDSVKRRSKADLIYRDLAAQRIGRQRAVAELRKLNKRQKGGWLTTRLLRR